MRSTGRNTQTTDWTTFVLYFIMVFIGVANIYAAVYDPTANAADNDFWRSNAGKQLTWIAIASVGIIIIMLLDFRIYRTLAYPAYVASMLSLIAVMFLARDIKGAQSWFEIGGIRIQPSEFAKVTTALVLARFIDTPNIRMSNFLHHLVGFALMALPMGLIVLQGDTGSALVFGAFFLTMYLFGLPAVYLIIGLVLTFFFVLTLFFQEDINYIMLAIGGVAVVACLYIWFYVKRRKLSYFMAVGAGVAMSITLVLGINFILNNVMKEHQRKRIEILINPELDPRGFGFQVNQSKIAIGSGGLTGKGFLEGTQTKMDFVPDQSTDFIFCTVGEEHGWLGSLLVISLFVLLIYRVMLMADRQKSIFAKAYGYSVACIFFMHFMINIGMTIGLFPVIGIPLPFFSYGGSSLISFTTLLFVLIKLDSHRMQVLGR